MVLLSTSGASRDEILVFAALSFRGGGGGVVDWKTGTGVLLSSLALCRLVDCLSLDLLLDLDFLMGKQLLPKSALLPKLPFSSSPG